MKISLERIKVTDLLKPRKPLKIVSYLLEILSWKVSLSPAA